MATGDANGVAVEGVWLIPVCVTAGHAEVPQRGEEDLTVGSWYQVVQDRVYGRADVEQDIGQHVEIVVEVI